MEVQAAATETPNLRSSCLYRVVQMDVWIQDKPSLPTSVCDIDVEVNEKEEAEWAGCTLAAANTANNRENGILLLGYKLQIMIS